MSHFFLSSNEPGSATHGLNESKSDGIDFLPTHRQGILAMSVDQFVAMNKASFPNHIKIDVDGLEGEIIKSMPEALSNPELKSIVIEVATDLSGGSIENIIVRSGFKSIMEESWESTSGVIKNIVFERV